MKIRILISVIPLLFLSCISASNTTSETTDKQVSTPINVDKLGNGISIHRLDNGLEILLIQNPGLPAVGFNVQVKVGSAYETFSTSGMSHMLEHLLFNGTTTRTQKELYDDTDNIGGYNNANTAEYYTNFMMVVPEENYKAGMELQADMLFNSIIPEDKFEKEKGIVLEEIAASRIKADFQMENNIIAILHKGHSLSLPTLGTYSTIEHLSRDIVYNYYKQAYTPNNMIFSAIGNFDKDEMLTAIREVYGKVKPADFTQKLDPMAVSGMTETATDYTFHRFYNGEEIVVQLFYELPLSESSEFYNLLNLGLTSAFDALEQEYKTNYPDDVKSLSYMFRVVPAPFKSTLEVSLTLLKGSDNISLANSLDAKIKALTPTLSESDVKLKISQKQTDFYRNLEKPHMFGVYNAQTFALKGIDGVLKSYMGNGYLQAANRVKSFRFSGTPTLIVQHPESSSDKNTNQNASTQYFKNTDGQAQVIASQNAASKLLAVHYMMKHKAFLEAQFGSEAAFILHDCMEQRFKSQENVSRNEKFGLSFKFNDNPYFPMDDIYLHPDFGYIRVEGLAENLSELFNYLNSQFLTFVPSQAEFDIAMSKISHKNQGMGGPKSSKTFKDTLSATIWEKAKYIPGKSVTYENLLEFAKMYMHPSNIIVSVISPETPEAIEGYLENYRGDNAPEFPYEQAYEQKLIIPTKAVTVDINIGEERSYLYRGYFMETQAEDLPALQILSQILSEKIVFEVRERKGMAYHMRAGISIHQGTAQMYMNLGTRPENVNTLLPLLNSYFSESFIGKISEEDLEKTKNQYLGRMMFRRLSSINNAYYLANSLYFTGDVNSKSDFLNTLKNVTLSDLKRIMKKYLKTDNPVTVIVR